MATKKNSSVKKAPARNPIKAAAAPSHTKTSPARKRAPAKRSSSSVSTDHTEQPVRTANASSTPSIRFKKSYAIILLAIIALIALLYAMRSVFVAATVNGQPISRLSVVKELEKQSGKQTLDSMVTKELILQEAKKRNITVTDQQVDDEIKKIEANLKQQGQDLDQVLSLQGLTRNGLRDQIKIQKTVEAILGNKVQVTDTEVDEYIASNSAQLPTDQDPKKLHDQIKQQLKQQKLSEAFQTWLADLRRNAKIDYLVTY